MSKYDKFYEARDVISEILQKDFIGPVKENEIITELPVQYYLMGKLYPQNSENEIVDTARNPFLESKSDAYDMALSLSNVRDPSSLGITFTLKNSVSSFYADISFAWYELTVDEEKQKIWKRNSTSCRRKVYIENETYKEDIEHNIKLYVHVNKIFENGEKVVTVSLLNGSIVTENNAEEVSKKAVFQVEIQIEPEEKESSIFTAVRKNIDLEIDEEMQELELLYNNNFCYAQGHGCSVEWDIQNPEPSWIKSKFFPSYELLQMKPKSFPDLKIFSMKYIIEEDGRKIIEGFREFMNLYEKWIDDIKISSKKLHEKHVEAAKRNVEKCSQTLMQISKTIDELEKSFNGDKKVWQAFILANEAMFIQRKQTLKKNNKEFNESEISWYPFQLAFIMHEMISFINPNGKERQKADLLWFPTGGGKTEAYLGISAFVIFLRRLRNQNDDGVTIIMRYTLRLLTIQQFERASMLIFACEFLRRKYKLEGNEISIGLWVGGSLTPNKLDESRRSIERQKREGEVAEQEEKNPCQIKVCPWCGTIITPKDYQVDADRSKMIIRCPNEECETNTLEDGMPMHIIDEAIYENLPAFIVATVDKFAQMPLNSKPASIFGINKNKKPPELIIQDELHLISGPLGTMTGIYEAAVTKLCEFNGIPAKVIASTATIRNAKNQILELYGREHVQFPPQGIDINDSFFAVISKRTDKPSRKYFGVMGIGATPTTTLIRVNAAMLFATRYLAVKNFDEKIIDNYWTITGYFNSLRILGGASTQILDDVQSRFHYLCDTKFGNIYPGVDGKVLYDNIEELTSRMNNSQINKVIQIGMKKSYTTNNPFDAYSFILASNMISVGVDVGRLGAMVVSGQPKTNAEYIQATSRVGRDNPGIVVTAYNPLYSRDRSHYEQFLRYHSALYRYVEATSLTPFSDRARDRGLHALFVALCRYMIENLREDDDAVNFDKNSEEIANIENIILEYVKKVDPDELNFVKRELQDIKNQWEDQTVGSLNYHKNKNDKNLLKADTENDRFRTMNSMRNVDGQAGIYLLGR